MTNEFLYNLPLYAIQIEVGIQRIQCLKGGMLDLIKSQNQSENVIDGSVTHYS